uniref:Uncharacterized protein n=1 Tax=Chromera velia CCMP2878 TaxID=1169474 RepID=A0A0G4HDQ9_9ALVE|eukprot:Cvel_6422.t1-p1 / transcript=Cvel_6422.t1 / gene=Cvel_6422 / organism=Chromera_velia_CCMP2878 / gene_product=Sensory rhodopsin-2, putative / transcript_product=Sensory rhodopsin-2, putative / location=Cvel_scaffold314:41866-44217(+) / protein_length=356 / sequence_SO=supercontig / SO=protein_coding / is_pseudo=false
MVRAHLLFAALMGAAILAPLAEATRDYLAECIAEDAITPMSTITFGIRVAQASLFVLVGLFYWTRFPDPHVKDERLAVFSLCTSINGYIMLFSGCHNLIMLSDADDVIFEDCTRNDVGRFVQFVITCPLLTWQVSMLARSKMQRQVELVLCTFLMLVLGCWTNAIPEFNYRMMAFSLGALFFVLLVINLDWAVRETSDFKESLLKGRSHMRYICVCVVLTWITFPIAWIIGPAGLAVIPGQAEKITLAAMDLVSKLTFSGYVYYVRNKWTNTLKEETAMKAEAEAAGLDPPPLTTAKSPVTGLDRRTLKHQDAEAEKSKRLLLVLTNKKSEPAVEQTGEKEAEKEAAKEAGEVMDG